MQRRRPNLPKQCEFRRWSAERVRRKRVWLGADSITGCLIRLPVISSACIVKLDFHQRALTCDTSRRKCSQIATLLRIIGETRGERSVVRNNILLRRDRESAWSWTEFHLRFRRLSFDEASAHRRLKNLISVMNILHSSGRGNSGREKSPEKRRTRQSIGGVFFVAGSFFILDQNAPMAVRIYI